MKCVRCGAETETGCSQELCPHASLYKSVVGSQDQAILDLEDFPSASEDEDEGEGEEEEEDQFGDDEDDDSEDDDLNIDEHW